MSEFFRAMQNLGIEHKFGDQSKLASNNNHRYNGNFVRDHNDL